MPDLMPEGDAIRRAIKWVSGELQENPQKSAQKLVNDAVMRFDLSPKDADFLSDFFRKRQAGIDAGE